MAGRPIVIMGAGLSGLTLSRALNSYGFASVIYEERKNVPRNNYAITLHPSCYKPLSKMLGLHEADFRKSVAVDRALGGEGRLHESSYGYEGSFRAHRGTLEAMISRDLDIRWEALVTSVEWRKNRLTVGLNNDVFIEPDILVAAGGVHTRLTSYRPNAHNEQLKVLPYVAINGKRRMSSKRYNEIYASAMNGATTLETRCETFTLQIAMNECKDDEVGISYTYSRPARFVDPLHAPRREPSGADDIPPEFYEELSKLSNLPPVFADAFDVEQVKKDRLLSWLMRATDIQRDELLKRASDRIIMIGDSAHAQPILGGNGGNAAIKDGLDLAEYIYKHGYGDLKPFVRAHMEDWQAGVFESTRRIAEMHGIEFEEDHDHHDHDVD